MWSSQRSIGNDWDGDGKGHGAMRRRVGLISGVMNEESERKEAWGSSTSRQKGNKKSINAVADKVFEYAQSSTMHGLKYIGDRHLHYFERFFWVVAFSLAFSAAIYFIVRLFDKFWLMPVIMSLSPTSTSVRDVPFPAITICNMNNMRKSEVQRLKTEAMDSNNHEAILDERLIPDFCKSEAPPDDVQLTRNTTNNWYTMQRFISQMSQPCHKLLVYCAWHGETRPCEDIFNPSLTDEGMCCVFNRLKRDQIFRNPKNMSDLNVSYPFEIYDWSPERGFPENYNMEKQPFRPRGSGIHLGLTVVVDADLAEYYCSSENSEGFKVLLSNPLETPKVSSFAISVETARETKVVVIPKMMTADKEVMGIAIDKRMCYFENERNLTFYNVYNQRSCVLECEANFTLSICGCVMYYMPNQMEINMEEAMLNITSAKSNQLKACDCLPSCFEVSYGFAISSSPISNNLEHDEKYFPGYTEEYFKENMGIIHFYYMDRQFTSTVRGVLYGFTEFLSNTGGLLGLFLGFSFLSAVEIVYFLSIRVYFHFSKKNEKNLEVVDKKIITIANNPNIIVKNPFPYLQ